MAKESGVNVLLQVSDGAASPTNFITVAGQQSTEFVGDTETDDITDKSHSGPGVRNGPPRVEALQPMG
jgi:predicted secreted protein